MISDVYKININKFIENYIDFIKNCDYFMNINNIPSEIQNFIICQNNLPNLRKILLKLTNLNLNSNTITIWNIADFRNRCLSEYEDTLPEIHKNIWQYYMKFDLLYQCYKMQKDKNYDVDTIDGNPFYKLNKKEILDITNTFDLRHISSKKTNPDSANNPSTTYRELYKQLLIEVTNEYATNTISEDTFSSFESLIEGSLANQMIKKFYSFMLDEKKLISFLEDCSSKEVYIKLIPNKNPLIENYTRTLTKYKNALDKNTINFFSYIFKFNSKNQGYKKHYENILNFYDIPLYPIDLDKRSILDNIPAKYRYFVSLNLLFSIIESEKSLKFVTTCIDEFIKKTHKRELNNCNKNMAPGFLKPFNSYSVRNLYPYNIVKIQFVKNEMIQNTLIYNYNINHICIDNPMYQRLIIPCSFFSIEDFNNLELFYESNVSDITFNNKYIYIDLPIIIQNLVKFSLKLKTTNTKNNTEYKVSIHPITCRHVEGNSDIDELSDYVRYQNSSSNFSLKELFSPNSYYIAHTILELFYYYFNKS